MSKVLRFDREFGPPIVLAILPKHEQAKELIHALESADRNKGYVFVAMEIFSPFGGTHAK